VLEYLVGVDNSVLGVVRIGVLDDDDIAAILNLVEVEGVLVL
jgi:hypothetical protein